jgi:hypothetical protein
MVQKLVRRQNGGSLRCIVSIDSAASFFNSRHTGIRWQTGSVKFELGFRWALASGGISERNQLWNYS